MGSTLFAVFLFIFVLAICALGWISKKAVAWGTKLAAWFQTLFTHPRRALRILWEGFVANWTPSITVAVFLTSFIVDPPLFGYRATKVLFVAAMVLIYVRTCVAEEIHGKKEDRRERGTRISAMAIIFIILSATAFIMCGALENARRGKDATPENIWAASLFWRHIPDTLPLCSIPAASNDEVKVNPRDQLGYVWIPAGDFTMGCPPDTECDDYEKPAHQVAISKGFWLGQTEVTVGAYKRFAKAQGSYMPNPPNWELGWPDDLMPMENVSWEEADKYCQQRAGGRLPTEAEWEYATKGGQPGTRYGLLDDIAWYERNSNGQSHKVAQKCPNNFHLYDMLGNVSEWVHDWYGPYKAEAQVDPTGPDSGDSRVQRGLSSTYYSRGIRASKRENANQAHRGFGFGFRCVWTKPPS